MNTLECIKTRHSTQLINYLESSSIKCSTQVVVLHLAVIHN